MFKNKYLKNYSYKNLVKINLVQSIIMVLLIILCINLGNKVQELNKTIGTWDKYYELSQGVPGPKGDTGERGAKGPKGDTGERGAKGETGKTGPAGSSNSNGLSNNERRYIENLEKRLSDVEQEITITRKLPSRINLLEEKDFSRCIQSLVEAVNKGTSLKFNSGC